MPQRQQAVLDYLGARRSIPAKTYTGEIPDRAALEAILTTALRVPDHGKLQPWRLVVLDRKRMAALADLAEARADALAVDDDKRAKARGQYDLGHLAVAVIVSPKASDKIPQAEQILSAGALCMNIVHATTAAGWSACWLSGWPSHDANFRAAAFGCSEAESVAGIIHIGRAKSEDMPDRPRPDLAQIVDWG